MKDVHSYLVVNVGWSKLIFHLTSYLINRYRSQGAPLLCSLPFFLMFSLHYVVFLKLEWKFESVFCSVLLLKNEVQVSSQLIDVHFLFSFVEEEVVSAGVLVR